MSIDTTQEGAIYTGFVNEVDEAQHRATIFEWHKSDCGNVARFVVACQGRTSNLIEGDPVQVHHHMDTEGHLTREVIPDDVSWHVANNQ